MISMISPKLFLHYKRKIRILPLKIKLKKNSRWPYKWSNWTSPAIRHVRILYPLISCTEECNITSLEFLPNVYNLDPIMRHPHANPNRKTLSKTADQQFSKVSKSWKTREEWGTVTEQKGQRRHNEQMQGVLLLVPGNRNKTLKEKTDGMRLMSIL